MPRALAQRVATLRTHRVAMIPCIMAWASSGCASQRLPSVMWVRCLQQHTDCGVIAACCCCSAAHICRTSQAHDSGQCCISLHTYASVCCSLVCCCCPMQRQCTRGTLERRFSVARSRMACQDYFLATATHACQSLFCYRQPRRQHATAVCPHKHQHTRGQQPRERRLVSVPHDCCCRCWPSAAVV